MQSSGNELFLLIPCSNIFYALVFDTGVNFFPCLLLRSPCHTQSWCDPLWLINLFICGMFRSGVFEHSTVISFLLPLFRLVWSMSLGIIGIMTVKIYYSLSVLKLSKKITELSNFGFIYSVATLIKNSFIMFEGVSHLPQCHQGSTLTVMLSYASHCENTKVWQKLGRFMAQAVPGDNITDRHAETFKWP